MGEVYRARDRKLDRDVAIKILPEARASDPEQIARFEREAKTLAALNQPHIAQIYGLEESNGVRALVMELVEGPTLADRVAQGPIPLDEALPIVKQIAEALEAAHKQGKIWEAELGCESGVVSRLARVAVGGVGCGTVGHARSGLRFVSGPANGVTINPAM
jgi:serine/threonine protein kinase